MRKLTIIFLFLMVNVWLALGWTPPSPITPPDTIPDAVANMNMGILSGSVPVAESGDCPTGTYAFAWNGDHGDGDHYACTASGGATRLGTNDGTDRVSDAINSDGDNEFVMSTRDMYISWACAAGDLLDGDVATIWLSYYQPDTLTGQTNVFESFSANGGNRAKIQIKTNTRVNGYHRANSGTTADIDSANVVAVNASWVRIGYTFQVAADAEGDHYVSDNGSWNDGQGEDLDAWDQDCDYVAIGEFVGGGADPGQTIYIDDVYVINSYQAVDPCSTCKGQ